MTEKKQLEIRDRESRFEKIDEKLGKRSGEALRDYYSIIDERYYLWMAGLYHPGEYDSAGNPLGGGYYFSHSARDNAQFGIDIESTMQAIGFLNGSGLIEGYGNDFKAAIPEKMQKELIAFAKSLQCPEDGYFYHKQWGKNISLSRRGRDLDWATKLLRTFGDAPLYDTPNGVKGSLGAPLGGSVTDGEGEKSALPTELQTPENFKKYLWDIEEGYRTNSYYYGNMIGAIATQIVARGEEYIRIYEDFANSLQNPETGLWDDSVHYNSINGLMKISGTYNQLGIKFNNAERALLSAIDMVTFEGEDVKGKACINGVDVFNPFIAIHNLFSNIRQYGDASFVDRCLAKMKDSSYDIITVSKRKVEQFKKPDGSYGYSIGGVGGNSQAAPVAVAGTIEGDINGGNLVVQGVSNFLCRSLGVDVMPLYYPSDFDAYLDVIEKTRERLR